MHDQIWTVRLRTSGAIEETRHGWSHRPLFICSIDVVHSGAVKLTSLGYRTDLALLRLGGTHVEDRGDYLVVRSPHNPGHWWGNFLLLANPPADTMGQEWMNRFAAEFPGAEHIAFGFDGIGGHSGDLAWFIRHAFDVEADTVMTATVVHEPANMHTGAVYRQLVSDEDWGQSIELRMRCKEVELEGTSHRRYVTAQAHTNRALIEGGRGGWFGAFLDERLVAQMGLIAAEPGIARFQSVETDPSHRRRGLAGSLVYYVSQYGFNTLDAHTLVMVADPNYFAIDLYRAVGFVPAETQLQAERRPRPSRLSRT